MNRRLAGAGLALVGLAFIVWIADNLASFLGMLLVLFFLIAVVMKRA